jgi:hypothetical protein
VNLVNLFCDSEQDSERLLAAETDLSFKTSNLFLSGIPEGGAIYGSPSRRIAAREVGLPAIFLTHNSKTGNRTISQNIIRQLTAAIYMDDIITLVPNS